MRATVIIFVSVVVLLAAAVVLARVGRRRTGARDVEAREAFVRQYDGRGVPEHLLRNVYVQLRRGMPNERAELRPTDGIADVHHLKGLDLEDAVLEIVARSGGRIPLPEELDQLRARVQTVDDLVEYLTPFCRESEHA
jgi:hypothetical protein